MARSRQACVLFSIRVLFSSAACHYEGSKLGGSALFSCVIIYKAPRTTLTWGK